MPGFSRRSSGSWLLVGSLLLVALGLVLGACSTFRDIAGFSKQVRRAQAKVRISGRIDTQGPSQGTLVVVLGRVVEGKQAPVGVSVFVRENPGSFLFIVTAGAYQVGAYEDKNQDGLLDPDERVALISASPIFVLGPGESQTVDLTLEAGSELGEALAEPLDVLGLVERTPREQREFSLWAFSQQGVVCDDFDDPRFGPAAGHRGLWRPMDFLNQELAGVYMLEPYDPDRVPVIFVHGIAGYPQQFSTLIDGLDESRFQSWFYFYPSGVGLAGLASHFSTLLAKLQIAHGFDEVAVVAHSMGGLVSRGAVLDYEEDTGRDDVRLFISISTPWGGDVNARRTEGAPIALPESFRDMNPSSEFLRWLFYEDEGREQARPLPDGLDYHMIFGFVERGHSCTDGSVSCASQARAQVQEQALSVRVWNHGHVEILHSDQAVERVNRLLDARF